MLGYAGRMHFVDLTSSECRIESFDEAFARRHLGGNGFAAKVLYDHLRPGIDPFDPDNLIVFTIGSITITTVARMSAGR